MRRIEQLVDVPKLVLRIWAMLWIVLIILVIFKLCFNIWYPIVVDSSWFTRVCAVVDSNEWLKFIFVLPLFIGSVNIIFLTYTANLKYKNRKMMICFNLLFVINYVLKMSNNLLGTIFEILFIVIAIIINLKTKKIKFKFKKIGKLKVNPKVITILLRVLLPILTYLMINLWQFNIFFIRDIEKILNDLNFVVSMILQFDYYIFILNTWIGVYIVMGIFSWGFLWGKAETELKALRKEEYAKDEPNFDLIKEIDEELQRRQDAKKETI